MNFPREQMLAILQEFAGHVPQAIESARRTLPADFSGHVWQAITENMLKLHARLQQGRRRYSRAGWRLALRLPPAAAQIVNRLPGLRLIEVVFAEQDGALDLRQSLIEIEAAFSAPARRHPPSSQAHFWMVHPPCTAPRRYTAGYASV